MSDHPRVTIRMPQGRIDEFEQLVDKGMFKSRSEAICSLAYRGLDKAKADGPIEVKVIRERAWRKRPTDREDDSPYDDRNEEVVATLQDAGGELSQSELVDTLGWSQPLVSQVVSKMERHGDVERWRNPDNLRAKMVGLPELDNSTGTFYATKDAGRSSGVLHKRRYCRHIANLNDDEIIKGKRSAFDLDQDICSICGGVES